MIQNSEKRVIAIKIISKVFYFTLLCLGLFLILNGQVLDRFLQKQTAFREYEEKVTELPSVFTFTIPMTNQWKRLGEEFNISYGNLLSKPSQRTNLTMGDNLIDSVLMVHVEQTLSDGFVFLKITPQNVSHPMFPGYELTYNFASSTTKTNTKVVFSLRPENNTVRVNNRKNMDGDEDNISLKIGKMVSYKVKVEKYLFIPSRDPCRDKPYNELILNEVSKRINNCKNPCATESFGAKLNGILGNISFCSRIQDKKCYLEILEEAEKTIIAKPCTTLTYKGEVKNRESIDSKNQARFRFSFVHDRVKVKQEYLMMDLEAMVGEIGGTLGICVGFSLMELTNLLLGWLNLLISWIASKLEKQGRIQQVTPAERGDNPPTRLLLSKKIALLEESVSDLKRQLKSCE